MHRRTRSIYSFDLSKLRTLLMGGALGLGILASGTGCSGPTMEKVGDPLLGAAPAYVQPVPPNPAQNAQQQTPAAGHSNTSSLVPPIPPQQASPTSASLASQTRPLSNLAIPEPTPGSTWQRGTSNFTPGAPRVVPVPREESFSGASSPGVLPASSWAPNTPADAQAPQQLQQLLESRGVKGQKLNNHGNGVHLICGVPSRSNPTTRVVTYEVTAPDYASAVQAIVRQIDQQPPD